ncbi:MAG TPA: class I adenylate-forming enzyme family protein [Solirubrobacterales bacterium]|jgi:acyl-CoA synthetase (AMP-forming)/AMP-acid ligase II
MEAQRQPLVGDVPAWFAARPDADRPVLGLGELDKSWAQIEAATDGLAAGLAELGLEPGDRVATLLPNCAEYVEIMYGVARAGCVIVPLNTRSSGPELRRALAFSGALALISHARFGDKLDPVLEGGATIAAERRIVIGEAGEWVDYAELIGRGGAAPARRPSEDDLYWMPFTSGTTGMPKAAMVSHRRLIDQWRVVEHEFELRRGERMLVPGPFYHSLGFLFGLSALFAEGELIVHPEFDPAAVVEAIGAHRIAVLPAVPTMYTLLLEELAGREAELGSMRAVISAGSPLHTATKRGLVERFAPAGLFEFYGSTEVGITTVLRPADQLRKERSVGLPVRGAAIRLVDEHGAEVPPGTPGEVLKRGQLLGPAYFRNEEATAAIERDGWIATGDIGVLDEEGYLAIVDRRKDMIVSGGANVFPAEIEAVILTDPAVLEAAVIGTPDPVWGEAVTAVVVLRQGHSLDVEALVARCGAELAGYKKPRRVEIVDELPKTGSGKVMKPVLRERFWEQEGLRVS